MIGYDTAILKIGGSLITDRNSHEPRPDLRSMRRTALEISGYDQNLILVHGSGSYGHPQAQDTDLWTGVDTDEDRMDLARLQRLQSELNSIYCGILQEEGIPAFPVQPSAAGFMRKGRLHTLQETVIEGVMDLGLVPVLYGVPSYDAERDADILSGDEISCFLSEKIEANIVLHATDVEGVYDGNPEDSDSHLLEEITAFDPSLFSSSGRPDASGGMKGKVKHLFDYGQRGRIFSGKSRGNIKESLRGEETGTLVNPGSE